MPLALATGTQCLSSRSEGSGGRPCAGTLGGRPALRPRPARQGALRTQAVAEVLRSDGAEREALLCQRFQAHASAVSALLVLENGGEAASAPVPAWQDSWPVAKNTIVPSVATPWRQPRPSGQAEPLSFALRRPLRVVEASALAATLLTPRPCPGRNADQGNQLITASLDKTLALWRSTVGGAGRGLQL